MNEGYSFQTEIQIVKLTNGENIIGNIEPSDDLTVNISFPLRMDLITHMTPKGMAESLNLSRWMQPFSEQRVFTIDKNQVVTMAEASVGLTKYYKYVLQKIDDAPEPGKQLEEVHSKLEIDDPTNDEIYDELLEEMDTDDTIH